MIVSSSLQRKVEMKLKECFDIVKRTYPTADVGFPTFDYNKKGTTAGTCTYQTNHLSFNAVLLVENGDDFINRTVVHEMAHAMVYQVFGRDGLVNSRNGRWDHHGAKWKAMMVLLGADPSRTHSYDVSNAGRKGNHYVWECECGALCTVKKAKHEKMMSGGRYVHKCGGGKRGELQFVTLVERASANEAREVAANLKTKGEEVKKAEAPAPSGKKRGRRVNPSSNAGQAREFCRANPGSTSSDFRNWAEMQLGVSPHGARALYSKMKKAGLLQ